MSTEAEQRLAHVLTGGHLPNPEAELQTCPNCGHTFSGAENDNFAMEPESDPLEALAEALRAGGY